MAAPITTPTSVTPQGPSTTLHNTKHKTYTQEKKHTLVHDADSPRKQNNYVKDAQIALSTTSSPKSPIYSKELKTKFSLNDISRNDKDNIGKDSNTNCNIDENSNKSKENHLPFISKNLASSSSTNLSSKSTSNRIKHSSPGSPSQARAGTRRTGRDCALCLNQRSQTLPQYESVVLLHRLEEGLSQGQITSLQSSGTLQLVTSQWRQSKTADSKDSEFEESANDLSNSFQKDKEVNSHSESLDVRPTGRQLDGPQLVNHIQNDVNPKQQTAADHDIKSVTPVLSELPPTTHLHSRHTLVTSHCSIGSNSPAKTNHDTSSQFVSSISQVSPSSNSGFQTEGTSKALLASQPLIISTKVTDFGKDLDTPLNKDENNSVHNLTAKDSLLPNLETENSITPIKSKVKIVSVSEKVFNSIFHSEPLNSSDEESYPNSVNEESCENSANEESYINSENEDGCINSENEESYINSENEDSCINSVNDESYINSVNEESCINSVNDESYINSVNEESCLDPLSSIKSESKVSDTNEKKVLASISSILTSSPESSSLYSENIRSEPDNLSDLTGDSINNQFSETSEPVSSITLSKSSPKLSNTSSSDVKGPKSTQATCKFSFSKNKTNVISDLSSQKTNPPETSHFENTLSYQTNDNLLPTVERISENDIENSDSNKSTSTSDCKSSNTEIDVTDATKYLISTTEVNSTASENSLNNIKLHEPPESNISENHINLSMESTSATLSPISEEAKHLKSFEEPHQNSSNSEEKNMSSEKVSVFTYEKDCTERKPESKKSEKLLNLSSENTAETSSLISEEAIDAKSFEDPHQNSSQSEEKNMSSEKKSVFINKKVCAERKTISNSSEKISDSLPSINEDIQGTETDNMSSSKGLDSQLSKHSKDDLLKTLNESGSELKVSQNAQRNCLKETVKQNLHSIDSSENIKQDQSAKDSFDVNEVKFSNDTSNTVKVNESMNLVEISSVKKSDSYSDVKQDNKSSAEHIDKCKETDSDQNKSITDSKEEDSKVKKGQEKVLQACSLDTDVLPSELPIERKDEVKPPSCLLKIENKENYLSKLSVGTSPLKLKIINKIPEPSSGSPKSELMQSYDSSDEQSPNFTSEHEIISTCPESENDIIKNIPLSEGKTCASESDSQSPNSSSEREIISTYPDSLRNEIENIPLSEASTCVFESNSPCSSPSNSLAIDCKENSNSQNQPSSDIECKNNEINLNTKTQECEVVQSFTSCNDSNTSLKMRIKTKSAATVLPNGDNQENSESTIPKLVLTWKGNGAKKKYSLTHKVETSEDVDTLDITCKIQKSKKEKKHKIRHKEKTKKQCKVTKSKRHLELFGEDSNDSCDSSSLKSDFSSKGNSVHEPIVIPHHDSQSSVNLPYVGDSPQHSRSNSPFLQCRNLYEFSENVEKVCERLQTKAHTDSSDDSLSDSLPDIELPMLVDNETYGNESQVSLTENNTIDSNEASNDQKKISSVDNEASEEKESHALNSLEMNIDYKLIKKDSPDSPSNTNTQESSSKSQKSNTSSPIMIGGKPTATVEPYCRDNKRKIEPSSSQMPKLELIGEECMFSKSANKEIIFGRSNRNDHSLLPGENQRVQVVIPTKINVQKQDLQKQNDIPGLSQLPKEIANKSDEKDFESYKSIKRKHNIYQKLSYDMLYGSSKWEKDNFVVNFLSDTKLDKHSTIFNHLNLNRKDMSSQLEIVSKSNTADSIPIENLSEYSNIRPQSWPSASVNSSDSMMDIEYKSFSSKDDYLINYESKSFLNFNNTLPKFTNNALTEESSKQEDRASEPENTNTSSPGHEESEIDEVEAEEMHETQLTIDEGIQEPENRESDDDSLDNYQSITIFSDLTKEDEEYKKKNIIKSRKTSELAQQYISKDKKESNNDNESSNNDNDSNNSSNNNSSDESDRQSNLEIQYDPEFEKVWGERSRKCEEKKMKRLQLKKSLKQGNQESNDDFPPEALSPLSPHPPPIPDIAYSPINETPTEKGSACENDQEVLEKKSKNEKEKKAKDDCDKKKRGRKKKEISESDSDTDSCFEGGIEAGTQSRTVVLEAERDRRLAQELPGFNWLEQKIKNATLSIPSKNTPIAKSSNSTITYNPKKECNPRGTASIRNTASNIMCRQGMPTNTQTFGFNNDMPSLGESLEKDGKENAEEMRRYPYGNSPSMGVRSHLQTAVPIVPPSRVTALPKRRMSPTATNFQPHPSTSSNMLPNVNMSSQASTAASVSGTNSNPIYSSHTSYQANQQFSSQEQLPNYSQYSYQQPQMSLHPDKQHMPQQVQQSSMQQQNIPQVHNQMLMQPNTQQNQRTFQQSSQHCVPQHPQLHQHQQPAHDYSTPSNEYHNNQGNIQHHSMVSGAQQKSFQYHNIAQHEPQSLLPEEQMSRNSCSNQQEYKPISNNNKSYLRQQSMPYQQSSLSQQYPHKSYQRQQSLPYQQSAQSQHISTYHKQEETNHLKQEGEVTHKQYSEISSCQVKDDKHNQKNTTNPNKIDTSSDNSHTSQIGYQTTTSLHDLQGNKEKVTLIEIEDDVKTENIQEKKENDQDQGLKLLEELEEQFDDSKELIKNQNEISEVPRNISDLPKEVSDTSKETIDTSKGTSDKPNESVIIKQQVEQPSLNKDQPSSETVKKDTSNLPVSCQGKDKISSSTGGVAFSPKLHILKRAFSDMLKSDTQSDESELPVPKKPHLDVCSDTMPKCSVPPATLAETVIRSSVITSSRETKSVLDTESIVEKKDSSSNLGSSISHKDREEVTRFDNPTAVENKFKNKIDLPSEIKPKLKLDSTEKESSQKKEQEISESSSNVSISMLLDELRRTKEEVEKLKRVQETLLSDKDKNNKDTQFKENCKKEEIMEVSNKSKKDDKESVKKSGDEVLSYENDPDIIIEGEFESSKSAKISIRNDLIQAASKNVSSKDVSVREMNRLKMMFGISNSEVEVMPVMVPKTSVATQDLQRRNSADHLKDLQRRNSADHLKQNSPSPNMMTKPFKESQGNNDIDVLCTSSRRFDSKFSEVDITLTSNTSPHRLQPSPHSRQPSPHGIQPIPQRMQPPSPHRPIPSPQRLGPSPIRQQPSPHRSQISPHSENVWYDSLKQTKPQMIIEQESKRLRYSTSDLPDHSHLSQKSITPPMKPSSIIIRRHSDTAEIFPVDSPSIKSPKIPSTSYPIAFPNSRHISSTARMTQEIPHSNKSTAHPLSSSSHKCIHGRNSSECQECLMRIINERNGSQAHSFGPEKAKIHPVTGPPPLQFHSYKSPSPVSAMSLSPQESHSRVLLDQASSTMSKNLQHYQQLLSSIQKSYDADQRKLINEVPNREIATDLSQSRVIPPEYQHHRGMFGPHFQGYNSVREKVPHSYQETPHTRLQPIQSTGPRPQPIQSTGPQTFAPRVLVHAGRPPFREGIPDPNIHRLPTARHMYPGNPYHPHNPRLPFPPGPPGHFMGGQIPPSNVSHPRLPMAPSMVSKQSPDPGQSASTSSGHLKRDGKGSGLGDTKKTCFNCPQPAKFLCSGCKKAWYCSEDCQRKHWHAHNVGCVP